jgi:hypothetical protein
MASTDVATARSPEPAGPARGPFLASNRVALVAGAIATVLAAAVYFGLPHSRDLTSLWMLLAKLMPFVAAAIAVAYIDLAWAQRLRLHLILPPLCFLAFFAYFVPKILFYGNVGADFGQLYYTVLIMVPFVILALALSARLGGASRSTVLRLAFGMLIIQLSGIEDLAFLTVNDLSGTDYATIPDVWIWADHMTVRLGHPPTKYEAFAFIIVHLILAVLVFTVPGRAVRAVARRFGRRGRGRSS